MRVLVYQNPDAGHERVLPQELVKRLERAGHEVNWTNLKDRPLSDSDVRAFDLVVAAGGDGSVGRTARQLVGSAVPIAVLPLGTANNLASILDAGRHDLVDRIDEWSILPFDAGRIEFTGEREWFFEGFGIGAFAETAAALTEHDRDAADQPSREAELARDIAALCERSRTQPPVQAELSLDGREIRGAFVMLEALNIGLLGPNVEPAAGVDPSDGSLDVVLVAESDRGLLTEYLEAIRAGAEPAPPFEAIRAREIRLALPSKRTAHLDGKFVDVPAHADIRLGIQPHAIRFLGGSSR